MAQASEKVPPVVSEAIELALQYRLGVEDPQERGMIWRIAWCNVDGCIAMMKYKSYDIGSEIEYEEITVRTGDWESAVESLLEEIRRLQELEEKAWNGGEKEVDIYVKMHSVLQQRIRGYVELMRSLKESRENRLYYIF